MFNLYIDDERYPRTDRNWTIARNAFQAKHLVTTNGVPDYISFDHDLGEGETGYDFAKWLLEYLNDNDLTLPENFDYNVHSANPVGAKNIAALMDFVKVHFHSEKDK